MNTLIREALKKLAGNDPKFLQDLSSMVDEVNRAATSDDAVYRETTDPAPVATNERRSLPASPRLVRILPSFRTSPRKL